MSAAKRAKSLDKHAICKKVVSALKKHYKSRMPKHELPILETFLYSICLEDASVEQAEHAYELLGSMFYDWNEVRVSSVSELVAVFDGLTEPEWRAARVRSVLQYVFEKYFAFDFESLRRKTLDLAGKQVAKIKYITPFVQSYVLQTTMGAHLVPMDQKMCRAAIWLGLTPPETSPKDCSEAMKSAVRKADVSEFCHVVRMLATDPEVEMELNSSKHQPNADEVAFDSAPDRLTELLNLAEERARTRRSKQTPKKTAPLRSTATRTTATKKK